MHVTFLIEENASPSGGSAVGASKQMSADGSEAHVQCALVQSVRLGSVCACFFSLRIALFAPGGAAAPPPPLAPPPRRPAGVPLPPPPPSFRGVIATKNSPARGKNN